MEISHTLSYMDTYNQPNMKSSDEL